MPPAAPTTQWLEVSLTVNGETAEAVADVLARFAPEGVALEATRLETAPDTDETRPTGDVLVRAYLPVDADLEARRRQLEEALWHLGQILPLPAPNYQPIAETNWSEAWKANFHPMRLGRRLMIIPAWLNPPLEPTDLPIRLDPGMAFGTGTHPTTQLCLLALERHLKPGGRVLDLGTGSGILAIAAAKLGAAHVLGVDIDDEAVRVAGENIVANGVAGQVRIGRGSLAEVLADQYGAEWRGAPLVVANILARVIVTLLAEGLADTVQAGGRLIVSGILDSQAYQVNAALKMAGLNVLAQEQIDDWVAIIADKPEEA
ncbi:MAG: 50S ribosomal protein L11 methyltransferase [Anaerolineales bacterium]|nr:50S ribosomal protein L11 methyltransferase [Anaerolineales bacterium]